MTVLTADQWQKIGEAIFKAAGASEVNAKIVTESLVDSNLAGHDSHGVIRINQYIRYIENGYLNPAATPEIVKETPSTSLVDGKWTFGQVGAQMAMRNAIEKAKKQGIAITGLIHANHIGRLGEYSEMASRDGMIGMVMIGGFDGVGGAQHKTGVVPFGGARPAFGTNPLSFGIPAGDKPRVLVDFATSAVAGGKISVAQANGVPLPPDCILDKDGNPTTNAEDFYDGGMLLSFGAHKGYGLAFVIELLSQVLTGADQCREEKLGGGLYTKTGTTFVVIDPAIFRPLADFESAAGNLIAKIKDIPPAPGFEEVLVPGEPEHRSKSKRISEGIPGPATFWQELRDTADRYGVDLTPLSQ